jgi:flagellar secretion chaperone FliS
MKEHSMTPIAGSDYLQTEVLTATPQRLQLMLIDAAIRSTSYARQQFAAQNVEAAFPSLLRAQSIMAELLSGLRPQSKDDLVARVAAVYIFVYTVLVTANLEHSAEKLDDALRVLETERETWRRICEQLGSERHEATAGMSLAGASFEA